MCFNFSSFWKQSALIFFFFNFCTGARYSHLFTSTLLSQTLKVEGKKVPFVFQIFYQGLRYGRSKNLQVFPFDVTYWKIITFKAAVPDWFGQKYLTGCLKRTNGMELTWELINSRNFDFLCSPTLHPSWLWIGPHWHIYSQDQAKSAIIC